VQILSVHSDPSALESFLGLSAATAGEVSKSCKSNGVGYFTGSSLVLYQLWVLHGIICEMQRCLLT